MKVFVLVCLAILISACRVKKKEPLIESEKTPLAIVSGYCNARQMINAAQMEKYIADSYFIVSDNGDSRPYNRPAAYPICDWEKAMHTKWAYTILGIDSNIVTVLLREENDYYTLLGLGAGIQVTQYSVNGDKIEKGVSKMFITEKETQGKAYHRFTDWLFSQPGLSEPELINANGSLIFDGKSAPRMLYWLKKWNEERPAG